MAEVLFHCPICTGLLAVDSSMAGCQVACPTCQGVVTIPAMEAPAPAPPSFAPPAPPALPPDAMASLNCPLCTGLFQVMASSQGQQVTCPHCGGLIQVPLFDTGDPSSAAAPPYGSPYEPPYSSAPDPAHASPGPLWAPQPLFPSAPSVPSPPPPWQPERPSASRPIPLHQAAPESFAPAPANRPIPATPSLPGFPVFDPAKKEPTKATRSEPVAMLPTEDGGTVALHDPVKTVGRPGQEIELRQLSPEEKAKRRLTRNIIMVTASLLLLLIVMVVLMQVG